jgi:GAF domain-containing protein
MKRRSKAGEKPSKGRRRKAPPKRRNVPKDTPALNVPNSKNDLEFRQLTRELGEAREQQAATSEVLKAISRSTFDLRTVLDTLLQSAVRLCEADQGTVAQRKGDTYYRSVSYGFPPAYLDYVKDIPVKPGRDTGTGRALLEGKVIHIPDVLADPDFTWKEGQRLGGFRTVLGVPMLRDGVALGVLALTRSAVRPFSDEQITLVENFAAQAVIAIENARLLDELRQRTTDLVEALEQQTATSEVLRVISSTPGDLQPVFATMLENAVRICDANFGNIYSWDGDALCLVATHNAPFVFAEARRLSKLRPSSKTPTGRMIANKKVVHTADLRVEQAYAERDPYIVAGVELGGVRTVLMVPMLKEDELIGAVSVYRQEVRPFTDKQIALVENFAAQAVIAIENARLLNELRETLEQQTATAEVLGVISRSKFELQPVLQSILDTAARLCRAEQAQIRLSEGGCYHLAAVSGHGIVPAYLEIERQIVVWPGPGTVVGRAAMEREVVQIEDAWNDPLYEKKEDAKIGGVRSMIGVPLMREGEPIGVMALARTRVEPFVAHEIELVKTFADQSVIAIENARLLNDLRQRTDDLSEALEQQTATSNVLQVISSSSGNLEPVFATMLENAVRLCDAKFGSINRWDGEALHLVATCNVPSAFAEFRKRTPFRPGPENPISQMLMTKTVIHFHDLATEQGYIERNPTFVAAVELGGVRTFLAVPMLKENELIGVVIVYRQEVRPFNDRQIEIARNFAAQAVIAIENARLLNELRQRTTDLTEALEQQTATSEVLQVISSSPGDLEPVFASMLEKAIRVCEATFGNIYRWDGEAFYLLATKNTPQAFAEYRRSASPVIRPAPNTLFGRLAAARKLIHIPDLAADQLYSEKTSPAVVAAVELGGVRTILVVPMLKEDELIGCVFLFRQQTNPFTEKQIDLVKNFAAQAVIAIENARLLTELRQRTEQVEAQSQELVKLNQQLEQRVTDQVGEIERMSRLRRFLPPQVADLIVASGSEKQLESHRREITALFCDLRGFTGFSESADPEDVMTLLREYHEAIGESIIKYSGTLERYAGDGVMVVFNDPVPVENPALQAVLMALEMRDAIGASTETWRRWGHDIGFGIGIAHGFATLGTIGFEGRFDYAAIGTVSNVASRLCDEAKPGQILISPRVLTKVENAVKVEPVGEFELKGIRRPLAAYNVVGAAQESN